MRPAGITLNIVNQHHHRRYAEVAGCSSSGWLEEVAEQGGTAPASGARLLVESSQLWSGAAKLSDSEREKRLVRYHHVFKEQCVPWTSLCVSTDESCIGKVSTLCGVLQSVNTGLCTWVVPQVRGGARDRTFFSEANSTSQGAPGEGRPPQMSLSTGGPRGTPREARNMHGHARNEKARNVTKPFLC